jgi:SAM-dependent methyltransferase
MTYQEKLQSILFEPETNPVLRKGVFPYEVSRHRFARAVKLLGNPRGKNIVEIGPYPGTGLYYFGEQNKVTGMGKSSPEFTRKVEQCGHRMVDVDFENDDIPDQYCNFADIVLCMEVIEHIRRPKKFINNVNKMLKMGGGKMLITTNNASFSRNILRLLLSQTCLDSIESEDTFYPEHTRYYHLSELCTYLEHRGLQIEHRANVNYIIPARFKKSRTAYLKHLLIRLAPRKYSTHIEIVAKKIKNNT